MEADIQYEFRVFGINDYGIGDPDDVVICPTIKEHETIGPIDIHCGEGLPKVKFSFHILEPFIDEQKTETKIPYKL